MSDHARKDIATPSNVITIIRILLVPVFVAALLAPWPEFFGLNVRFSDEWKSIIAAVVFVIISGTDWLDGYLARSRNEVTDFGKFMDPLADKILVTAALICLVELGDLPTWVVLIILAREFIVSGVRMMAASKGVVIAASMVGKFKTVFQMIAIVLFALKRSAIVASLGPSFQAFAWWFSWFFMFVALALTIASMVDYLVKSRAIIGIIEAGSNGGGEGGEGVEDGDVLSVIALETLVFQRAAELVELASRLEATVSTAESLTGGMIGSTITSVPGSSAIFNGGIISYTNDVKRNSLGVDGETLELHGAVSEPVAMQMAKGARVKLHSTLSVAVTGLAGPDGDEYGNPVGTVCFAVSTIEQTRATTRVFTGDRGAIRLKTTAYAIELVIDEIHALYAQ